MNSLHLDVKFNGLIQAFENLGILETFHFLVQRFIIGRFFPGYFKSRYSQHPLHYRWNKSDVYVFRQIFIQREYSYLDNLTNVGLIVDCGANVGYSSSYFLTQFPNSHVIAIEPDPENFAIMRKNLLPYGERVETFNAAVWSHPTNYILAE